MIHVMRRRRFSQDDGQRVWGDSGEPRRADRNPLICLPPVKVIERAVYPIILCNGGTGCRYYLGPVEGMPDGVKPAGGMRKAAMPKEVTRAVKRKHTVKPT